MDLDLWSSFGGNLIFRVILDISLVWAGHVNLEYICLWLIGTQHFLWNICSLDLESCNCFGSVTLLNLLFIFVLESNCLWNLFCWKGLGQTLSISSLSTYRQLTLYLEIGTVHLDLDLDLTFGLFLLIVCKVVGIG